MCDYLVQQINLFDMKRILEGTNKNVNFSVLSFDVLSENEMLKVRGGAKIRPKTRDKDIYVED